MSKIIPINILMLLMLSSFGLAISGNSAYSNASPNDYGVYLYFNSLLGDFSSVLDGILKKDNTTLEKATLLYSQINVTKEELVLYSLQGINPKALELMPHFEALGKGAFDIAVGQKEFLDGIERKDYSKAHNALFSMKFGLKECYSALEYLSQVKLSGGEGELKFELGKIFEKLKNIERTIKRYEAILNKRSKPTDFTLFVSNPSPFVYENVTFYGYTIGLKNISVVINNVTYPADIPDGKFYLKHSFEKVGTYEVYAIGINGSEKKFSNKILVNVTKMPTEIIPIQKISKEGIIVEGYLVDYFRNGVGEKELVAHINNKTLFTKTNPDGSFMFSLGPLFEALNMVISFSGDETYAGCNITIHLEPSKKPLTIRIFYNKQKVRVNERVEIRGLINGTSEIIPLTIYVDDEPYDTINAQGNFSFILYLKEGKHKIYAYFSGNKEFAESISNFIFLEAIPIDYTKRLLLVIVFVILAFVSYKFITSPKIEKRREGLIQEPLKISEEEPSEELSILRAYRAVYNFLRKIYSLPKSVTPRELLNKLKEEPFFRELEKLTMLHEKYLYARRKLGIKEILSSFKLAARVILGALVREEL